MISATCRSPFVSWATIIELQTQSAKEVVDITARVEALLDGAKGGSCLLYLRHTTAGLMVVTFETGVPEDIMDILQTMTPAIAYRHDSAAHVAAHFLSALVGPSVHVPVRDGRLALGEFQKIVLMEFEGPRRREIEMRLLAEASLRIRAGAPAASSPCIPCARLRAAGAAG